jgi:DMSO/TMAO reductase YedYZ heme-binding membrane subunit
MARKKRVRRTSKRGVSKRAVLGSGDLKKKITIVLNNFLLFVALALVSSIFGFVGFIQNEILVNLFQVMSTIFGFVALAFLITLLILVIMKILKKK